MDHVAVGHLRNQLQVVPAVPEHCLVATVGTTERDLASYTDRPAEILALENCANTTTSSVEDRESICCTVVGRLEPIVVAVSRSRLRPRSLPKVRSIEIVKVGSTCNWRDRDRTRWPPAVLLAASLELDPKIGSIRVWTRLAE